MDRQDLHGWKEQARPLLPRALHGALEQEGAQPPQAERVPGVAALEGLHDAEEAAAPPMGQRLAHAGGRLRTEGGLSGPRPRYWIDSIKTLCTRNDTGVTQSRD